MKKGILVEDEKYFAESISMYLATFKKNYDLDLVDTLEDCRDLSAYLKANKNIDFVILDLGFNGSCGIDVLKNLRHIYKDIKFIIYSGKLQNAFVKELFLLGADACVSKSSLCDELFYAIEYTFNTGIYVCKYTNAKYCSQKNAEKYYKLYLEEELTPKSDKYNLLSEIIPLTKTEELVVESVLQNKDNKEIAESLFISLETAKKHKKNIFKKLGTSKFNSIIYKLKENTLFFLKRPLGENKV